MISQDEFVATFGGVARPIGDPPFHTTIATWQDRLTPNPIRSVLKVHQIEHMWQPGETCWIGTMKFADLHTVSPQVLHDDLVGYFSALSGPGESPQEHLDTFFSLLIKHLWLSYEYIHAGKQFKNPLMVYWDPRKQINKIHPGGARHKIIQLFNDSGETEVIYFNTGGFWHSSMQNLTPVSCGYLEDELGYAGNVIADHGTFIPQYITPADYTAQYVEREQWHKNFLSKIENGISIYIEQALPHSSLVKLFQPWLVNSKQDADIVIDFFTDSIDLNEANKVIITALAGINFECNTFAISHK